MATEPSPHQPSPVRRRLLRNAVALATGALGAGSGAWALDPVGVPRVVTAWNAGERSWAGLWTPGKPSRGIALPARAHQLLALPNAQHGSTQVLVLARRPGEYLLRMDPQNNKALQWLTMEDDRYLGGHAVLSREGRTFFTTETDGDSGQGLIAERELNTLKKLREFPSGGIGPHALLQEPSGTLLVANGGILNLPETGRRKLNLGRMDSNLTRLDLQSGQVLAKYRLQDPFLSMRHLALAPDGTVGVALQAEHSDLQDCQRAPVLALLKEDNLQSVTWKTEQPVADWDGYTGDICYAQAQFWVSAPRAGWLLRLNSDLELIFTQALPKVCPLATNGQHLVAGGQQSAVHYFSADANPALHPVFTSWDNHSVMLRNH
jgi:uncharacterized protein